MYLSTDAYAVVARWLALWPGGPDTPLCPNARGKRMTVSGLQDRLGHYADRAGVQVTCHQLRHTYARQLVEHDLPVTTLSKLLGHACLSTTQVYLSGADPQVRQDYAAAMGTWETPSPEDPGPRTPPPDPPAAPRPAAWPELAAPPVPEPELADTWAKALPEWVRDACLAGVRHQARNWKASQQRRHSQRRLDELAQFWTWQLAHRPLQAWRELTRADLQAYVDERLATGRAPSTIKNVLYPLWDVLRQRQQAGDPIFESVFRLELPKGRQAAPRHLTEAEATRLERHLQAYLAHDTPEARREAAWAFVLAHTGIRLNELVDLRRGDLDLAGGRLRIDQGKGRKDRVVYLSATTQHALTRYLAALPALPADAPLFYRTAGLPLAYRWVEDRLRKLGDEAGVAHVTPHRLRHTLATRLINRGMPVTTLQKILGHEDLNSTQRYARVADPTVERDYRQAMARLEQEAHALSLAPLSLDAWLSSRVQRECVTQPLDNSV